MSLTHYEIERKLQQKADLHEVHTLRGDVDRLERALREFSPRLMAFALGAKGWKKVVRN